MECIVGLHLETFGGIAQSMPPLRDSCPRAERSVPRVWIACRSCTMVRVGS